jgi:quercetin dioxygenase-like cupin family protein
MRRTSRFVRQSALVMGALTLMISTPGQAQTEAAKAPAPTLHSSSQVSDAPGKGILPMISGHMAAGLSLYHLDAQPIEQVSLLIQRQYLHGSQSTFAKWIVKKGAVVPLHHHANEQITWITQGEAEVYSQGKNYVMHAGDIMIIPPNVPHEFRFTQDTIDIDIFSPQRQDWMDGTADYFSKE